MPSDLHMCVCVCVCVYTQGLQLIPGLSPTSWFTTVFPLCCVLAVNAIKEAYDDIGRHRCARHSDRDTVRTSSACNPQLPTTA